MSTSVFDNVREIRRPHVPVTLPAAIGVMVSQRAIVGEGLGWLSGVASVSTLFLAVLCSLLFVVLAVRFRSQKPYGLIVLSVALLAGCASASHALDAGHMRASRLSQTPLSSLSLVVGSDATLGTRGYRCKAEALLDGSRMGSVWLVTKDPLSTGAEVRCSGSFTPNQDDEWGVSSRLQGVVGTVRVSHVVETRPAKGPQALPLMLRESTLAMLVPGGSEERALIAGCVCGSKSELRRRGLDDLFARTGTSHLVAVSGSHIALATALLCAAFDRLRMPKPLKLPLLAVGSGTFVLFCGAPVSAIRSWVMATVGLGATMLGRRSHGLSSASVVALLMSLADPSLVGQLGFVLSVTSVCALCLFCPYVTAFLSALCAGWSLPRRAPRPLCRAFWHILESVSTSLSASLVASCATLPIVAESFGRVSLAGPLTNALLAMPFLVFMYASLVALPLLWIPGVGTIAIVPCDVLAHLILQVMRFTARIPFASVSTEGWGVVITPVMVVGLVLLLLLWPRVTRGRARALAAIAALAVLLPLLRVGIGSTARICVLDIGQGDAVLVQDGTHALLVDTGPDDAIVDALQRNGVYRLDAIILTHLHDDHYGGIASLANGTSCARVLVGAGAKKNVPRELKEAIGELCQSPIEELGYGDVVHVGGFTLRMVSPVDAAPGTENPDSIVLEVEFDDGESSLTALLTGDAEKDELGAALVRDDVGDIDLLKVGHHGSEPSITKEQALALDPEVSVASAGEGNRYGHPTPECEQALGAASSLFLCTKDVGDVEIRPGRAGPIVCTARVLTGDSPS